MNKFIKRLIATGLSVATVLSNFNVTSNAFDWNDDDLNWVNLDALNKNGIVSLSEKQCKKRLGWDNCAEDVFKLDFVEKYVDMLIENYNNLKQDKISLDNINRIAAIDIALNRLKNIVIQPINDNFIHIVRIADPNSFNDGWASSGYEEKINSNYNKNRLENIVKEKIIPARKDIDTYLKEINIKNLPNPGMPKFFSFYIWSSVLALLVAIALPFLPKNLKAKDILNSYKNYYKNLKKTSNSK